MAFFHSSPNELRLQLRLFRGSVAELRLHPPPIRRGATPLTDGECDRHRSAGPIGGRVAIFWFATRTPATKVLCHKRPQKKFRGHSPQPCQGWGVTERVPNSAPLVVLEIEQRIGDPGGPFGMPALASGLVATLSAMPHWAALIFEVVCVPLDGRSDRAMRNRLSSYSEHPHPLGSNGARPRNCGASHQVPQKELLDRMHNDHTSPSPLVVALEQTYRQSKPRGVSPWRAGSFPCPQGRLDLGQLLVQCPD